MIPTTRRMRLATFAATTAAVFCTATPANAATTTVRVAHAEAAITVTNCPTTVGAHCLVFALNGDIDRPPSGTTTRVFAAVAKEAIVQPGGTLDVTALSTSAASSIGAITMSASGRTAALSMTVTMACLLPGCGVEGTYRFLLRFQERPGSTYVGIDLLNSTRDDACRTTTRIVSKLHRDVTGSGTVKRVGHAALQVHVDTTQGADNEISTNTTTTRTMAGCPP